MNAVQIIITVFSSIIGTGGLGSLFLFLYKKHEQKEKTKRRIIDNDHETFRELLKTPDSKYLDLMAQKILYEGKKLETLEEASDTLKTIKKAFDELNIKEKLNKIIDNLDNNSNNKDGMIKDEENSKQN